MTRLALAVLLLGCGNEPKAVNDQQPASDAPASTPASSAPATRAPQPAKARLIGSWKVDLSYISTDAEMLELPPEQRKKAMEMARAVLKDLRIVFGDDGTVKVGTAQKMNVGTYVVTPTGAETLSVDATMKTPNGAETRETLNVEFVGEKIMVTGPDGKATRFMK